MKVFGVSEASYFCVAKVILIYPSKWKALQYLKLFRFWGVESKTVKKTSFKDGINEDLSWPGACDTKLYKRRMSSIQGRALHFVFKICERGRTAFFYRQVLGMKVLRHEEFAEGCEASCNGPYNSRWSKTMVGYGPEDSHFAIELTFNYPIKSYDRGNDFISITVQSSEALQRAKSNDWPILAGNILEAPGGYRFSIIDKPEPKDKDPVQIVTLASSNLANSLNYWHGILELKVFEKDTANSKALLGYNEFQTKLELQEIKEPVTHKTGYGRIAFSCPYDQQPYVDEKVRAANTTILIPMKELETPGKPTVRVLILADPDGHEICMVDDERFRELSQYAPNEEKILDRFIKKDESGELKKQDEMRAAAATSNAS
ncbi:hypothetical protein Trydic_g17262 [Trypoxylus dichotomus]